MNVLELINTRDISYGLYYNPEEALHPSIATCEEQIKQLREKCKISNQKLCELLIAKTGKYWSYEIKEKDDFESDNLFNSGSKSLILTFSADDGQSLCAMGAHSSARNREILENANWFDVLLSMRTSSKEDRNVVLPTGHTTLVAGNNEILYKTLMETAGKLEVETLLSDSKSQPSTKTPNANKGGEGK